MGKSILLTVFSFVCYLLVAISSVWMLTTCCADWSTWYEFTLTNIDWAATARVVGVCALTLFVFCLATNLCVMSVVWGYEDYKIQK